MRVCRFADGVYVAGTEGVAFHLQPHLAAAVLTQLHHAPIVHPQATMMASRLPKPDTEFTMDDIKKYFNIPAKQAAKKLNIGITKLKLVCRHLGTTPFLSLASSQGSYLEQVCGDGPIAHCVLPPRNPPRRSRLVCARKGF